MVSMHMGIASMVLLQAVRAGCAPVVCLLVTMGMDMNERLIAWIALLKAVRAVCAPKCF